MSMPLNAVLVIILSIVLQLGMAFIFAKEALFTPVGSYCWIKCSLAVCLYLGVSVLLAFGLYASN